MNEMIVATQAEYDEAAARIARHQNRPYFDIEAGRGTGIVEEVNYLMYNYLYRNGNRDKTIGDLSRFYFTPEQALKITDYFREHLPGDMFDIERGLNRLAVRPDSDEQTETGEIPKIIIRNNTENISVNTDVEVSGYSYIEAFGNARITARNNAYVIARENTWVDACDKTRVDAFDRSGVKAFHNANVFASGESTVLARHKTSVVSKDKATVYAYHEAYVHSTDNVSITAHNRTTVDANGKSTVQAYDRSLIKARDTSRVFAHDAAEIYAMDRSRITANNYSCVVARNKAVITALGNALILTRDNVRTAVRENACHISGNDNNARNLQENLYLVMKNPRFAGDPVLAARMLMRGVPYENKIAINRKYFAMGCNSGEETKRILARWMKTYDRDISYRAMPSPGAAGIPREPAQGR
jgi:hypothetical protein